MPKVSVIIPVYNVEAYLRECLDSVLNQALLDIEIICVDDGSTDGSAAILAEYTARDSRVRIVTQKNAGAGAARNTGLSLAKG
jgi:glycosyltransferase involved in cell wall biosynthesis